MDTLEWFYQIIWLTTMRPKVIDSYNYPLFAIGIVGGNGREMLFNITSPN
jgi:hypothetical protein